MDKRGQMAIWIIVAIFLVGAILLVLTLNKKPDVQKNELEDISSIIENCVKDSVNEVVDKILPQGGFVEPAYFKFYNKTNVTYLCSNKGSFSPCINQHPMFIEEVRDEVYNYINPRIDNCFKTTENEMKKRGITLLVGEQYLNISLAYGKIFVNIEREVTLTKGSDSRSYSKFNFDIENPLYDLVRVAIEISNQEAQNCFFDYGGYSLIYPKFRINKQVLSDSTKIYKIVDVETDKEMAIAIRSCAIPRGI